MERDSNKDTKQIPKQGRAEMKGNANILDSLSRILACRSRSGIEVLRYRRMSTSTEQF